MTAIVDHMVPCEMCGVHHITWDVYWEEGKMCQACSDDYFAHDHEDCSWGCMADLPNVLRAKRIAEIKEGGVSDA